MIEMRPPTAYGPATRHAPRRRRQLRMLAAVLVAAILTVGAAHYYLADDRRQYLSSDGWPVDGQGAYQLGDATPRASSDERPVPIASLAKVMTAYLVLQHLPLPGSGPGPRFRVTSADVADTEHRRSTGQSVVDVRAGERISERAALLALLLPSANNIAVLLAREVSGSVPAFVAEMNATASSFGMKDTVYTDPSGFDAGTVSTAIDQLRLADVVADDADLASLMAARTAMLPVAGQVSNTDSLLGKDGFVGMKTGSDDAAGGCFMFRSRRVVNGRIMELVGVVLGQRGHNLIDAGLYAAKQLADRVAPRAAPPSHP